MFCEHPTSAAAPASIAAIRTETIKHLAKA
jgi:hypothetical protein